MDNQEEAGLPLDGNAAAGLLRELFALDVTAAEVTCGRCSIVAVLQERESTVESWEQYFAALTATTLSRD